MHEIILYLCFGRVDEHNLPLASRLRKKNGKRKRGKERTIRFRDHVVRPHCNAL